MSGALPKKGYFLLNKTKRFKLLKNLPKSLLDLKYDSGFFRLENCNNLPNKIINIECDLMTNYLPNSIENVNFTKGIKKRKKYNLFFNNKIKKIKVSNFLNNGKIIFLKIPVNVRYILLSIDNNTNVNNYFTKKSIINDIKILK